MASTSTIQYIYIKASGSAVATLLRRHIQEPEVEETGGFVEVTTFLD